MISFAIDGCRWYALYFDFNAHANELIPTSLIGCGYVETKGRLANEILSINIFPRKRHSCIPSRTTPLFEKCHLLNKSTGDINVERSMFSFQMPKNFAKAKVSAVNVPGTKWLFCSRPNMVECNWAGVSRWTWATLGVRRMFSAWRTRNVRGEEAAR